MDDAGYFRKIIRITAEDSPNVRYAREEKAAGRKPTGRMLIPGVLGWEEYLYRLATWDPIRQSIGLFAQFYAGAELYLFPQAWLDSAEQLHHTLKVGVRRAKGVGVDPAQGGDRTAMTACDEMGVFRMVSLKTPDTSKIIPLVTDFVRDVGANWRDVTFDAGGGGKQIGDQLRANGKNVRIISFADSIQPDIKKGMQLFSKRKDAVEDRKTFANRRAQLYGTLAEMINPNSPKRFALLPSNSCEAAERLRHQLSLIPKMYDQEDKLMLPPKNRKAGAKANTGTIRPLVELIGYSPDEADATVMAIDGMLLRLARPRVGVF